MRKFTYLGLAAAAFGLVVGSMSSASAETIGGGGCRTVNGVVQGAYVGHGVSLLPCAYSDNYGSSMYARVSVSGTPDTQLRVWQAVARVNSDGSITDFYPGVLNTYANDLTSATSSQVFGHDLYCAVGGTLVIDTWITDNGYRMGSVQSARFTC